MSFVGQDSRLGRRPGQLAIQRPVVTAATAVEALGARRFAKDLANARQEVAGHVVVGAVQKGMAQGGPRRLVFRGAAVVDHALPGIKDAEIRDLFTELRDEETEHVKMLQDAMTRLPSSASIEAEFDPDEAPYL